MHSGNRLALLEMASYLPEFNFNALFTMKIIPSSNFLISYNTSKISRKYAPISNSKKQLKGLQVFALHLLQASVANRPKEHNKIKQKIQKRPKHDYNKGTAIHEERWSQSLRS